MSIFVPEGAYLDAAAKERTLNRFQYIIKELTYRRGRSIATAASIALSVLAAVLLIGIATSYTKAIQAPMKSVGANVVVQLSGDIPSKLEGLVFPHPNALLPRDKIEKIEKIPGVVALTRAVYFWELAPNPYKSILGIEDSEAGLGGLNKRLVDGRKIASGDRAVLIDSDFAAKKGLKAGDKLAITDESFEIYGIVDAATSGKVVHADVYMPLGLAQQLAANAPQVTELYPFGLDDSNTLLVKVEQQQLRSVVEAARKIIGKKAIVSSELSFQETLDSVLFLSEKMGLILALVIGAFAIAFVLRATVSAVNERRREMALLSALGWRPNHIRSQVILENVILAIIGTIAGLVLAIVIAQMMGGIEITIDLPWDLSSTPHFIPEATLDKTEHITAPISMPWQLLTTAGVGGVLVGFAAAIVAASMKRPQPWSLLSGE